MPRCVILTPVQTDIASFTVPMKKISNSWGESPLLFFHFHISSTNLDVRDTMSASDRAEMLQFKISGVQMFSSRWRFRIDFHEHNWPKWSRNKPTKSEVCELKTGNWTCKSCLLKQCGTPRHCLWESNSKANTQLWEEAAWLDGKSYNNARDWEKCWLFICAANNPFCLGRQYWDHLLLLRWLKQRRKKERL